MEKELNVIEVQPSGIKHWNGGAYTIAFLYTKHKGNLIVKGYYEEVKNYISSNYTHYFVNYTLWSNKKFRSIWAFWIDSYYIASPDRSRSKYKKPNYKWYIKKFYRSEKFLTFRRFPKRWVKEFDDLH